MNCAALGKKYDFIDGIIFHDGCYFIQKYLESNVYNVPGRSVADMAHETVCAYFRYPVLWASKRPTGNIERAQWLRNPRC